MKLFKINTKPKAPNKIELGGENPYLKLILPDVIKKGYSQQQFLKIYNSVVVEKNYGWFENVAKCSTRSLIEKLELSLSPFRVDNDTERNMAPSHKIAMYEIRSKILKVVEEVRIEEERLDSSKSKNHAKATSPFHEILADNYVEQFEYAIYSTIDKFDCNTVPIFYVNKVIMQRIAAIHLKKLDETSGEYISKHVSKKLVVFFLQAHLNAIFTTNPKYLAHACTKAPAGVVQDMVQKTNCFVFDPHHPRKINYWVNPMPSINKPNPWLMGKDGIVYRDERCIITGVDYRSYLVKSVGDSNILTTCEDNTFVELLNKIECDGQIFDIETAKDLIIDAMDKWQLIEEAMENRVRLEHFEEILAYVIKHNIGVPGHEHEINSFLHLNLSNTIKDDKRYSKGEIAAISQNMARDYAARFREFKQICFINGNVVYPKISCDFRGRMYFTGSLSITNSKFVRYSISSGVFLNPSQKIDAINFHEKTFDVGSLAGISYMSAVNRNQVPIISADATASGMQIIAIAANDPELARVCNVITENGVQVDPYQQLSKGPDGKISRLSRAELKLLFITSLYGSKLSSICKRLKPTSKLKGNELIDELKMCVKNINDRAPNIGVLRNFLYGKIDIEGKVTQISKFCIYAEELGYVVTIQYLEHEELQIKYKVPAGHDFEPRYVEMKDGTLGVRKLIVKDMNTMYDILHERDGESASLSTYLSTTPIDSQGKPDTTSQNQGLTPGTSNYCVDGAENDDDDDVSYLNSSRFPQKAVLFKKYNLDVDNYACDGFSIKRVRFHIGGSKSAKSDLSKIKLAVRANFCHFIDALAIYYMKGECKSEFPMYCVHDNFIVPFDRYDQTIKMYANSLEKVRRDSSANLEGFQKCLDENLPNANTINDGEIADKCRGLKVST
jgi:hypothetical protein